MDLSKLLNPIKYLVMAVKKRGNKGAYEGSMMRSHTSELNCCGGKAAVVKFSFNFFNTSLTSAKITNLIIREDGELKQLDVAEYDDQTLKAARIAICNTFKAAGYDPHYSMDDLIGVKVSSANQIDIISEVEIVSIKIGRSGAAITPIVKPESSRVYGGRFSANYTEQISITDGEDMLEVNVMEFSSELPSFIEDFLAEFEGLDLKLSSFKVISTSDADEKIVMDLYFNKRLSDLTFSGNFTYTSLGSMRGFVSL